MPSVEANPVYQERYDPLQDARKSDIHYRASKSKILRSLGVSSYRNGSQFAMVWVSPSGEIADAYASEALQPKLMEWLGRRVQAEARDAVKAWKLDKERRSSSGEERIEVEGVYGTEGEMFRPDQVDDDMSDGEQPDRERKTHVSTTSDPTRPRTTPAAKPSEALPTPSTSSSRLGHRSNRSLGTTDALATAQGSPSIAPASLTSLGPDAKTMAAPNGSLATKMTPEEVDNWFTTRLGELSHKTDKIVCRSWIKVIEPHKQTKFQYQKGDETKPAWWPAGIRHKEPDHLGKHERIALLLHLLRLPFVTVNQLECATSAVSMQIPAHKLPILNSIYDFARAERKAMQSQSSSISLSPSFPPAEDMDSSLPTLPSPPMPTADARTHRTQRSRPKNSIGSPNTPDFALAQQTPRSARASPYPLARSASATNELSNLTLGSATSPSLGHAPASASLSRSQSAAGLNAASTARPPRVNGRASVGEGDLQATPYQGGRIRTTITPRQAAAQGSPLSASMGRSASTSAIGAKTMMDDSVASPAMIKSRSKLSQKCFEQLGAGARTDARGGGGSGGGVEMIGQPDFGQFSPQQFAMVHPHHLESMRPPHPEGFPPPAPLPSQQHHLVARLPHSHSQPHLQHQNSHSRVQVQVQVHAGHGLPIPPATQHHQNASPSSSSYSFAYAHSPSQPYSTSPALHHPSGAHFAHSDAQQPLQFVAPNGLVYEQHAVSASTMLPVAEDAAADAAAGYYGGGGGGQTPSLAGYIHSPELGQHGHGREWVLHHPGGGREAGSDLYEPNPYLAAGAEFDSSVLSGGGEDSDLTAYVRQLEGFERQQAQQQQQPQAGGVAYEVGLGFESGGPHDLSAYVGHEEYY
ncbi:hypothetical protein JCM11491_001953 [Sporobolomyces phaffii]